MHSEGLAGSLLLHRDLRTAALAGMHRRSLCPEAQRSMEVTNFYDALALLLFLALAVFLTACGLFVALQGLKASRRELPRLFRRRHH